MQGERLLDGLSERVIGCAIAVHRVLGPGLLESVYKACLRIELEENGLRVETERRIAFTYRDRPVSADLICDLLVEEQLLVELKAVEQIHPVHIAQVITYLKISGCPVGLLINFNTTSLRNGLRRLEHPDIYTPRRWRSSAGAEPAPVQVGSTPAPRTDTSATAKPPIRVTRDPQFE
jgi:GxxExxY protein